MSQERTHDLRSNLVKRQSISPGDNYTAVADITGDWVQADDMQGPVQALVSCGAAVGGPSAFSLSFEMWEADDSGGTNAQIVATQTKAVLTADDTAEVIRAITTKPFVRVVLEDDDSSFTGGSSPGIDVGATVLGQDRSY